MTAVTEQKLSAAVFYFLLICYTNNIRDGEPVPYIQKERRITVDSRQRKPNRISEYDYGQNGAYFVTVCAQDRRKILSDIVGGGFPVSWEAKRLPYIQK